MEWLPGCLVHTGGTGNRSEAVMARPAATSRPILVPPNALEHEDVVASLLLIEAGEAPQRWHHPLTCRHRPGRQLSAKSSPPTCQRSRLTGAAG